MNYPKWWIILIEQLVVSNNTCHLTYSVFAEIYVFMDRWIWCYVSVNTIENNLSSQVSNIASWEQIWRTECEWTLGICSFFDPTFNLNITFNSYIYIMLALLWIIGCFNMTYKLYIKTWHNISIYFTIIKLSRLLIDQNTFYVSNIHYYYHHHKLHFPSSKTFGGKIFSWKGYRATMIQEWNGNENWVLKEVFGKNIELELELYYVRGVQDSILFMCCVRIHVFEL